MAVEEVEALVYFNCNNYFVVIRCIRTKYSACSITSYFQLSHIYIYFLFIITF